MALALKRLVSSSILPTSLRRTIIPSASHFFNINAFRQYDDDDDDRDLDFDRRSARSFPPRHRDNFFSDGFEPFLPTRSQSQSQSQFLNLMDQIAEHPVFVGARGGFQPVWDAKETEDALKLSIDMPGLGKEDVKVFVNQSTLVIKGDGGEEEGMRRYASRIDLPAKIYKTDEIKAEMKNGVLKVTLPKAKEDEGTDVLHVKVE